MIYPGGASDGKLRILNYDIAAFSDEMLAEFTNQTGYEIEMIRTDDSGGILEQLLQTQQAQQADLAIGLDNTYIVYTADHGMAIGRHGLQGKQNLYEHTWRVPLIVKGPGIKAGSRARGNVYLLDVLATLCDIASIEAPKTCEGTSFLPVLKGTQNIVRKNLYGAYCGGAKPGIRSIRSGDWKLIKYESTKDGVQETQLFNLADNPEEFIQEHHQEALTTLMGRSPEPLQKNLADDPNHEQKRKELENLLLAEMRRLDDPYRLWDQPDDGLPIPETRNPDPKEKKSQRKKNR